MIFGQKPLYNNCLVGEEMIYVCVKCKFLFERKNEPSKCPSCENQYVVEANSDELQSYKQMHKSAADAENSPDTGQNEHNKIE